MNLDFEVLFVKYRSAGILVDTNILLMYVVGLVNRQRIPLFKRTKQFSVEGFELLDQILRAFHTVVTTPNILTEVNSLANQLSAPEKAQFLKLFATTISRLEETHYASQQLSKLPEFQKFGLTDCSILNLSRNQYLVLTDDFRLSSYLQTKGIDAVNFTNLRPFIWPT